MHHAGIFACLVVAAFTTWTGSATAQSLDICSGIDLRGPEGGQMLDNGYRSSFTWDSEPSGTASREWTSISIDARNNGKVSIGDGVRVPADRGGHKAFAGNRRGDQSWAVIFYDQQGQPICMTKAETYAVVAESSIAQPASTTQRVAEAAAAAQVALGRYIVRLAGAGNDNTFYTGASDRNVLSDNYDDTTDADDWRARGYTGLEIQGNQRNNVIVGSDLADLIYGGDESCSGELCIGFGGQLGDTIVGGDGDDVIDGGDESCTGDYCSMRARTGDTIDGGAGNDTITAGNETCDGLYCSYQGHVGDSIDGGDGDDTIDGGAESCTGTLCGYLGGSGDILTTSTGTDIVTTVP